MPYQIVLFKTGLTWMLKQLIVGGNTVVDGQVTFRFFSNDVTLSPDGPSAPFIALSMPGYTPFVLSGAVDEGIDANGNDTWIWPVETIAYTTGGSPPFIAYGYWVTANSDGTALWGQLFDTPPAWSSAGDAATVAPQFSLGALALPSQPVLTPVVLSVSPNYGPHVSNSPVLISGSYFTGATAVQFGGVDAITFDVVGDNTIAATTPTGSVGVVDVQVTTPAGTSEIWVYDQFTYT